MLEVGVIQGNEILVFVTLNYVVHAHFSGEKVSRTLVVLKMAIQFRKKRNGTKTVIFTSLKIFPKPAKILHVLRCEFSPL